MQLALERQSSGPFFFGDRAGLADVYAAPFCFRLFVLEYFCDFDLPPEKFKRFNAWITALSKRDAFAKTSLSREEYLEASKKFVAPTILTENSLS